MFRWNNDKNEKLKRERGITFELLLEKGEIVSVDENKSACHEGQLVMHVLYNNYIFKIPFVVEVNGNWFLKTAFPDRKLTKEYRNKGVL